MDPEDVKAYYKNEDVVFHYALAVNRVGLWKSEELLLTRLFSPDQKLLELGCGAGRIAFGLYNLGYRSILVTDYSEDMVAMAKSIALEQQIELPVEAADACDLSYGDEQFDGVVFGFNGLMQIPNSMRRLEAMKEIARVIKPGSHFFFTTHDRDNPKHRRHWKKDLKMWEQDRQPEEYDEFGDRIGDTEWGDMYIFVPTRGEIQELLEDAGFRLVSCQKRSEVAVEDRATREFSDECLIWVAAKK